MRKHGPQRTFWARVKEAAEERLRASGHHRAKVTQTQIATRLGLKQPSVSDWNKPGHAATIETTLALAAEYGVCVEWLYNERGPKYPGDPQDFLAQQLAAVWPHLDDDVKRDLIGLARLKAKPHVASPSPGPLGAPSAGGMTRRAS